MGPLLCLIAVLCCNAICCHGQQDVILGSNENQMTAERLDARLREMEQLLSRLNSRVHHSHVSRAGDGAEGFVLGTDKRLGMSKLIPGLYTFPASRGIQLGAVNNEGSEFYVTLSSTTAMTKGQTLKFNNIVTNNGNVYDKSTGEFTCPMPGTYVFHLTLSCEPDNYMEVSIVVKREGEIVATPYFNMICERDKTGPATQNGGSALLKLNKGDKVMVQMMWPSLGKEDVSGNGRTTFSGYMLRSA